MTKATSEADEVRRVVANIHAGVLSIVCAVAGGLAIFLMTVWLLIKGGPEVGLHLRLLRHYFVGYSVTWTGSVVGFLYGALVGGVIGWAVGKIYNMVAELRRR